MNPSGIDANESITHRSSGPLRQISARRYGLAILSVGVALGASLLLDHFHFRVPSALLLLFAVAISSWYAGAGPAVLAAILSTISFYWYFVEPVHTIYIYRSEIPYFVIFTAFAALLSRFGTFRQRAEADLRRTHDQLKVERPKLGSRTIALLYFAFSSCWILFTDRLVHGLGLSNAYLLKVSEAKGILFISLSTLLMYVLVEKALRQRHSVATAYWQLVETAQEGVWSVDAEGKTVFANENMAAILGTSPGEMIGKSILPFVPQEKKDELLNHLLQREQGLQEHYEFPFLRADGAQVWTLLRVSPVLRDGQHSGCLALVSDITKGKRAEEALRRLNRELRAISNCNQALLRATDEQSLLEEICRIVCEEAGYRMAWVSYAEHDEAKSVRPVAWTGAEEGYLASAGITWADTDRGRSPTGTAIRSGKSCCIQDFAKDPRLAPWREGLLQRGFRSGIALPLKDENDNAFGSLTIHSAQPNAFTSEEVRLLEELAGDLAFGIVTLRSRAARKQAEQALRQSEAYLAEAQRLSHTGSWALDVASGNYVYSSEEYLRICGFDPQQGLPTKDQPLQQIHPDDFDEFWQAFQKLVDEKVDSEGEYRIVLPDGTVKYVHAIRHPVLNANGELVEIVGTTVDITERKRADEALRRSQAYLAEAQRLTHTGSFAYDGRTNTFPYWSEEHFRIWGFDPRQGPPDGETLLQRVHPEDREMVRELSVKALRERRDYTAEYRIVLPDGTVKHIEAIGHLLSVERGGPIEVIGTHVDVTERKRAEAALRAQANLLNLTHDAIFVADMEGVIKYWNRGAEERYGWTADQTLGRVVHELLKTVFPKLREEIIAEVTRTGRWEGELVHTKKDGTQVVVASRWSLQRGEQNAPVAILETNNDITERKRAEEEVRNTAAQWQATFDAVQESVLLLDKDFRVLRANHAAAEFLGLPFDKIVGGHCYDLTHATSTPPAECPLAKMRQSRRHEEAEVLARKGGPWLSVSVDPLFDPSGELTQVVHVARDITDRKRAEEERERLRQLEADLAHIDRVSILGELTASIAHEINQPLSGIVSSGSACLRWLARDVPDLEEAREAARRIVRDGKRAGEIIARIRALTKKAVASRAKLNLNETIREVLALVGDEAKRNTVVIRTRFGDDVFPVLGDQVQLQQVVLNLVMNAIEAMSKVGDRARELVITTRNIDPDQVQVTVEDSGVGIDPQMIDKIFDSFYTTKPGGMGMGLSISRSILQSHGGRLWATAKDGAGTSFHFTLPKYHEEESNAGVAAA
jgi:PAS domain S-box-containing protein